MNVLFKKPPHGARGFTLVELLVVITIIGMLMALLIPAIGGAQENARLAQCTNNIRQLAVGLANYETSRQRFPGYLQPFPRSDNTFLQIDTSGGVANSAFTSTDPSLSTADQRPLSQVSWAALLLTEIDQQEIYDLMVDGSVDGGPQTFIGPIEVFRCPSDVDLLSNPDNAGMTYSANTGNWDWDGEVTDSLDQEFIQPGATSAPGDVKFNGMFFNLTRLSRPITQSLSSVRDGVSNTILLSENVHKELEDDSYTWMGVGAAQPGEQQLGVVWVSSLQPNLEDPESPLFQQPLSVEGNDAPPYPANVPEYARPASLHAAGIFNVAFVDGHADTIAADIDYTVYQRLMTPQGRKVEDPSTDNSTTITELRQLAPLGAEDF